MSILQVAESIERVKSVRQGAILANSSINSKNNDLSHVP